MTALVLGGSVFVGKHTVDALLAAGHEVAVLNRGRTPATWPVGVEHLVADRTDAAALRAVLAGREWDVAVDVSGFVMAAGGADIADLLGLLDGRIGRYVYVSSIMAYDQRLVGVFPWTENLPTDPTGPRTYGGFKAAAETRMLERHGSTGFPVTIVRPAAIYGPDNNIFDMETPMFLRFLQHRPVLVPHGGLVVGSYGHVDDLCAAMVALAAAPEADGEVVNVTTDSVDVRRYVDVLAGVVGVEPDVVEIPDDLLGGLTRPAFGHLFGRRHHAMLDTAKLARLSGATAPPRYDLRSGHEHTYQWFLAQGWDRLDEPLVDPVWRATWDFEAEDALVALVRG